MAMRSRGSCVEYLSSGGFDCPFPPGGCQKRSCSRSQGSLFQGIPGEHGFAPIPGPRQAGEGDDKGLKGVVHPDNKKTRQAAGDSLGRVSRRQVRALHSTLAPK